TALRTGRITPELFDTLLEDPDDEVRKTLVSVPDGQRHPVWHTDERFDAPTLILRLLDHPDVQVRRAALCCYKHVSMAAASKAAHDPELSVRAQAAQYAHLPLPDYLSLIHDWPFHAGQWERLAGRWWGCRTPSEVLLEMARLVTDPCHIAPLDPEQVDEVRKQLCRNEATPAEAMRLLHRAGMEVGFYLHWGWPPEAVVEQSFAGAHHYDAETAGDHAALDDLERKVRDLGEAGDWGAALAMMLDSEFRSLINSARASCFVDPARLGAWVRSHPDDLRYSHIPENPATPAEILLEWAREGEYLHEMMQNPALPDEVLEAIGNHDALSRLRIRALRATPEWRGEAPVATPAPTSDDEVL
ncbi:MAG: hypothetical protein FWE61_11600, partial [Micrococcales bacterium]|nr:hypothetical protein [Micrococcales bacterium]